ncbi:MAG: excalibur calcium-binding domain-containing protein [Thiogranum sp.]
MIVIAICHRPHYFLGKTHCSQMSSCKEAKFYLNNCPGTKMDGDGDGVPCESQWCSF